MPVPLPRAVSTVAALAILLGCLLTGCSTSGSPAPPDFDVEPGVDAAETGEEASSPIPRDWRDACFLSLEEITSLIAPLVATGRADYWSRAATTDGGFTGDGGVSCTYIDETDWSILEIVVVPRDADDEPTFELRCAEVQSRPPYTAEPDAIAECDPSVAGGLVISNDRGIAFLFPGEAFTARIWLYSIGLGSDLTYLLRQVAQKVGDRWMFG